MEMNCIDRLLRKIDEIVDRALAGTRELFL